MEALDTCFYRLALHHVAGGCVLCTARWKKDQWENVSQRYQMVSRSCSGQEATREYSSTAECRLKSPTLLCDPSHRCSSLHLVDSMVYKIFLKNCCLQSISEYIFFCSGSPMINFWGFMVIFVLIRKFIPVHISWWASIIDSVRGSLVKEGGRARQLCSDNWIDLLFVTTSLHLEKSPSVASGQVLCECSLNVCWQKWFFRGCFCRASSDSLTHNWLSNFSLWAPYRPSL